MSGKVIETIDVEKAAAELCVKANTVLRADVLEGLKKSYEKEREGSLSRKMLKVLLDNADIAEDRKMPLCQDTGMVTVFIEIGKDVVISDGNINDAVNSGVEKAYKENYFRKSVVEDPILRKNTGTNTPAVLHIDLVEGDKLNITVMPKGFGSENKGRISMLNPTSGPDEIIDFCVETVKKAGPDACPPYVLGIGIGGTMEQCAYLAKKALLRPINSENSKTHISELEYKIEEKVNALKIGVMGLGGLQTVMGVSIESAPTHIAGLPVAVNLSCHALRSASVELVGGLAN